MQVAAKRAVNYGGADSDDCFFMTLPSLTSDSCDRSMYNMSWNIFITHIGDEEAHVSTHGSHIVPSDFAKFLQCVHSQANELHVQLTKQCRSGASSEIMHSATAAIDT